MKHTNQNSLFLKEFITNLSSLDTQGFKFAITALPNLFEILGNSRFFNEAMPLILKFSAFVDQSLVIDLVQKLSTIKFNIDNEGYLQAYADTLSSLIDSPESAIVAAVETEAVKLFEKHYNQRVVENFILNCYCSPYTRVKKVGLRTLQSFGSMTLSLNPNFYYDMFEKYFESEKVEVLKTAFKSFSLFLKGRNVDSRKEFIAKWADKLYNNEHDFIQMYWVDFMIKINDTNYTDKNLPQFISAKSFYIKKHVFDNMSEVIELVSNKPLFIDFFSDLLYSKDKEFVALAIENIPLMVKLIPGKPELKMVFNNLRNFIQTCEDDQINYMVIYYLLKCSKYMSKSDCIDFLLKSLLNYLRSDTETIDENFLDQIKEFIMVVGYSTVKESLGQFFSSLLVKPSQNVRL